MGVGKKLKILINNKGLTQREFAEAIEENVTQVNKVLNGDRNPSYELLIKSLSFFNDIDLNWLMRDNYNLNEDIPKVNEDGLSLNAEILNDIHKIDAVLLEMKKKVSQK